MVGILTVAEQNSEAMRREAGVILDNIVLAADNNGELDLVMREPLKARDQEIAILNEMLAERDKRIAAADAYFPKAAAEVVNAQEEIVRVRQQAIEALKAVTNYFWGTEPPVLKEGDVQELVDAAIRALAKEEAPHADPQEDK
jgi:hypothetical protein